MGADVIQAQYEQLDTIARRFADSARAHAGLLAELKRSLDPLQKGGWQGRGADAFFKELNEKVLPAVTRLADALDHGRKTALEIKQIVQAADEEASRPFRGEAVAGTPDNEGIPDAASGAEAEPLTRMNRDPQAYIDGFRNWGGLNLREEALAKDLLSKLPAEAKFVQAVFDKLPSSDRDDVAHSLAAQATNQQLAQIAATPEGKAVLMRMVRELQEGWTTGGHVITSPGSEAAEISRLIQAASPTHAYLMTEEWLKSKDVQDAFLASGAKLQSAHSFFAIGDYIFDEYSVTIRKMPPNLTPEALLSEMANDLNKAVDNWKFNTVNEFQRVDASQPPKIGDIYHIDIFGPDNGSVMLVERTPSHFIFQTVTNEQDGVHPEYGARQFGFERNSDGSVTFYTRGASRPEALPSIPSVGRVAQDVGWNSMTQGLADTVRQRGGIADDNTRQSWTSQRSSLLGSGAP